MTLLGLLLLDVGGLVFLFLILNLVRLGRLYVGYAAPFVLLVGGAMVTASTPALFRITASGMASFLPGAEALLLPFGFVLFLLVYVLSQLTIVSNRLATIVQELAIERVQPPTKSRDEGGSETGSA